MKFAILFPNRRSLAVSLFAWARLRPMISSFSFCHPQHPNQLPVPEPGALRRRQRFYVEKGDGGITRHRP